MEKSYYCGPWRVLWGVAWEYGVLGLLQLAIQSLYNQSKNCIHVHGTKSNTFLVGVAIRQGCPSSLILFVILMDRISRCSWGEK